MTAAALALYLLCAPEPGVGPAVFQAEARRVAVVDQARRTVLAVFSGGSDGGGGSGVVISADGYGLTNFHVAKPCGDAMKCGLPDGRLYDAVVVGLDPVGDVALIKLFGRDDFPAAELGDSDRLRQGDWVLVMGNPFLLADDFQPTLTYGILSGVHRYQYPAGTLLEYADCLQTDAAINPGNSGGPMFDDQGRLVGIVGRGSFEKRGRVSVDAGYAVSINQIRNFMGALRSGRIVDHATLGARAAFDDEGRVLVTDILDSSDAFRRGLRYGDEILRFGGRTIDTPNAFKNVLGIFPKGWCVPLSFRHEGQRHDVLVRLAGVHGEEELIEKAAGETPELPEPKPEGPQKEPRPGKSKPKPKRKAPDMPGPDPDAEPHGVPGAKPEMPKIVQQHFEARRGYANYFFNRQNRDRVWKAWTAGGSFAGLTGPWKLAARLPQGDPVTIQLDAAASELQSGTAQWRWEGQAEGEARVVPPGSGGMLLALYLWRRLAVLGPEDFGEVYYLGTVPVRTPLAPREVTPGLDSAKDHHAERDEYKLADVLVGLHAGAECHFLFDPADGALLGVELFTDEDTDPCEIELGDYAPVDGRRLPRLLRVRRGDEPFAELRLEKFDLEAAK